MAFSSLTVYGIFEIRAVSFDAMNTLLPTHRTLQNFSRDNHHFNWTRSMCYTISNHYLEISPLLKPWSIFLKKVMFIINKLNYADI